MIPDMIAEGLRGWFHLNREESAWITVLKSVENGILETVKKRPKTFLVTQDFEADLRRE
jgi:hypothetical protein